jgi:hypothetical protein
MPFPLKRGTKTTDLFYPIYPDLPRFAPYFRLIGTNALIFPTKLGLAESDIRRIA